ncbi:hypothetical protein AYL99_00249 [Fonsecaea erecta]|uniref:DUF1772 domain-containing protein n=1 Tax=Fonsecaea erecta TaxID=1367422 RepID=A0A178ZX60_9EURO|nr:hypothetical protein AYL99_00249 [Fonsecaea erecta]OAP64277.1 hypothetical protein AYL99_00249 [Fonsecaea erecta]
MEPSNYIRAAKVIGVTGAAWLGGNIAALSLIAVPALRRSGVEAGVPSSILAKQWRFLYDTGKAQNPPIATVTAAAYLYLAWSARRIAPLGQLPLYYGSAAVLTLGIVPFTLIAMHSTNNRLMQHSEQAASKSVSTPLQPASDDEVDGLIAKWIILNGVRSLFPLAGGILGIIAILG